MPRPVKTGLDYFSLDTDLDDKIEVLEAEHGLVGFAILVKLFQLIYKSGYFYNWNEREQKLFAKRINADKNIVSAIIISCLSKNWAPDGRYRVRSNRYYPCTIYSDTLL